MAMYVDPRPPFPTGWFHVVPSAELAPGEIREIVFCGEPVVIFRTERGEAAVAGAHCAHMGAHLARGGRVAGGHLVCPFHGFRWATDGRCVSGYPGEPPCTGRLAVRPTVERFGFVFAWHDADGGEPTWEIPDLDTAGWTEPLVTHTTMDTHPQTITENGVDTGHFAVVHGFPLQGDGEFEDRGHAFHCGFHFEAPSFFGGGRDCVRTYFDTDIYGLGFAISINHCEEVGLHYRVFVMPTPTEAGVVALALATSTQRPEAGDEISGLPVDRVAELAHRGAVGGIDQDRPIWEGLRFLEKPRLTSGDGPIASFRAYAERFYPNRRD